jgi:hypothetical protein
VGPDNIGKFAVAAAVVFLDFFAIAISSLEMSHPQPWRWIRAFRIPQCCTAASTQYQPIPHFASAGLSHDPL